MHNILSAAGYLKLLASDMDAEHLSLSEAAAKVRRTATDLEKLVQRLQQTFTTTDRLLLAAEARHADVDMALKIVRLMIAGGMLGGDEEAAVRHD